MYQTLETIIDTTQQEVRIPLSSFSFGKGLSRARLVTIAMPIHQYEKGENSFDFEEENINQNEFLSYLSKSIKKINV